MLLSHTSGNPLCALRHLTIFKPGIDHALDVAARRQSKLRCGCFGTSAAQSLFLGLRRTEMLTSFHGSPCIAALENVSPPTHHSQSRGHGKGSERLAVEALGFRRTSQVLLQSNRRDPGSARECKARAELSCEHQGRWPVLPQSAPSAGYQYCWPCMTKLQNCL